MARIKNPVSNQNMGRDRINSPSKDAIKKSGTALFSLVKGEQLHIGMTAAWLTNLSGCTITAKVVEGSNDGLGTVPTEQDATPVITVLPVLDADVSDNEFKLVFPDDLCDTWSTQPTPDKPVYGFVGVEIADSGSGDQQQKWKPVSGLVEILYSPTEVV
jgi:hypothetical protein